KDVNLRPSQSRNAILPGTAGSHGIILGDPPGQSSLEGTSPLLPLSPPVAVGQTPCPLVGGRLARTSGIDNKTVFVGGPSPLAQGREVSILGSPVFVSRGLSATPSRCIEICLFGWGR